MTPRYVTLHRTGELSRRAGKLLEMADPCRLCPVACGARRLHGETGPCHGSNHCEIDAHLLHTGEEPPISGFRGSGTLFFSGCSLACPFCQNHQISHGPGRQAESPDAAGCMLELQSAGAQNINWVTATHQLPWAVAALEVAAGRGLEIPLVYNTSGFENLEVLDLLDGIIDIALPDLKWMNVASERACGLSGRYAPVIQDVIRRLFDMTGPFVTDDDGIAVSGLLVRHLVLPGNLSDTDHALEFLAPFLEQGAGISLMAQYHPPEGKTLPPPLHRTLLPEEYYGFAYELRMLEPAVAFIQDPDAHAVYNPDFDNPDPFCHT